MKTARRPVSAGVACTLAYLTRQAARRANQRARLIAEWLRFIGELVGVLLLVAAIMGLVAGALWLVWQWVGPSFSRCCLAMTGRLIGYVIAYLSIVWLLMLCAAIVRRVWRWWSAARVAASESRCR
jgi:hypothetical protein